jgi:signal transduction histidine kinase
MVLNTYRIVTKSWPFFMDIAKTPRQTINTCILNPWVIPIIRLVLGTSALLLVVAERHSSGRSFSPPEGLLLGYLAYGLILSWLTRIRSPVLGKIGRWEHWVDAALYLSLVFLQGDKGPYFICPLLLAVFVASYRRGPVPAIIVTAVSSIAIIAWFLTSQVGAGRLDVGLDFIAPIALLMLGGMIAHLSGKDILLKRRLQFISAITDISNPRLGAASMISSFMEQLRGFYDADECILIMTDLGETEIKMRRIGRSNSPESKEAVRLSQDLARRFLGLPPEIAAIRQDRPHITIWPQVNYFEYNVSEGKPSTQAQSDCEKLSTILDSDCFMTMPLCYHKETIGRIFLTSSRACFEESDIQFLIQVCEHFMPLIDNTRLVDMMSTDACLAEREKIARDLHDTVLQPYIGLKLGIGCLRQKLEEQCLQMGDIDRLIEVNEHAIEDMRRYVSILKGKAEQEGDLLLSIRQFVEKFQFATGIAVDIDAGDLSQVEGRLSAEALQIISEGLSNIRRHTESNRARIYLHLLNGQLELRIEDTGSSTIGYKPFRPRSITERAEALGGKASVEPILQGGSRVLVEVPL